MEQLLIVTVICITFLAALTMMLISDKDVSIRFKHNSNELEIHVRKEKLHELI